MSEDEDCEIEQPCPVNLMSRNTPSLLEIDGYLVAAQWIEPFDLVSGRAASSPRLRGER